MRFFFVFSHVFSMFGETCFPKCCFFHTFFQCLAKMVSQNQWFFNVFRRKCSKTNGFSTLSSEQTTTTTSRSTDPRPGERQATANDKQPRTTSNRERRATANDEHPRTTSRPKVPPVGSRDGRRPKVPRPNFRGPKVQKPQ